MTIKLNLGAGPTEIEGYTSIDRKNGKEAYPLDYADDSVSVIRASHLLEHFDFGDARKALHDWVRALETNGILRISVPDFDQIAVRSHDDPAWHFYLMGGQTDENDYHKSVWCADRLIAFMEDAGLVELKSWSDDVKDTHRHPVSLNIQGRKPTELELRAIALAEADAEAKAITQDAGVDSEPQDQPELSPKVEVNGVAPPPPPELTKDITITSKIAAVGSIPRIGWNDHHGCLEEAFRKFGIKFRPFHGVFWGPCMSNVFEDLITAGVEWVFTLDYDTVFTERHVNEMLRTFAQYPHIDALASNEVRRNNDTPLATIQGVKKARHTGQPIRLSSAHFGLTLIRLSALQEVPMPWFKSEPGPNGSWRHEESMHYDIWFWHQWRLAGKTLYLAPDARVGQLEMTVVEFDEDMCAQRIRINDWMKREYGRTSRHEAIPAYQEGGAA